MSGTSFRERKNPMRMKERRHSGSGLQGLFGLFRLFGVFAYHREVWKGLGVRAFGTSRRNSARSAQASRCAKLHQKGGHHATNLPRGDGTILAFPRSVQCLSEIACQAQLVEGGDDQPTPALKLLGSPHMHLSPKQIVFEKAVTVLLRETQAIV